MTITEIQHSNSPEILVEMIQKNELYPSFEVRGNRDKYSVEFVDYAHSDIQAAKLIELLAFEELGDNRAEVSQEFELYDEGSIFVLLKRSGNTTALEEVSDEKRAGELVGMARFIPFHDRGNKTLNDLAVLMKPSEKRTHDQLFQDEEVNMGEISGVEDVSTLFQEQYDCDDLEKVIDIATLAPNMDLDLRDKMDVIESLLKAMDVFVIDLYKRDKLTHLTQFTFSAMHDILVNRFGYPMHNLFSLQPLVYDTFGNGKGVRENMVAVPSVINLAELEEVFKNSLQHPATKHMGSVVTQLVVNFPAYSRIAA